MCKHVMLDVQKAFDEEMDEQVMQEGSLCDCCIDICYWLLGGLSYIFILIYSNFKK